MHSLTALAKDAVGLGYFASFAAAGIACSGGTSTMTIEPGLKLGASVDQAVSVIAQLGGCHSTEDGDSWSISIAATVAGQGSCHFPSPILSMTGAGAGHFQWSSQGMTGMDKLQLSFDLKGNSATLSGAVVEGKFQGKGVVLKANIDDSSISDIATGCLTGGVHSVAIRVTSLTIDD